MSHEIVRYTPDLKGAVLKLQTHLWGPDPALNAAYLEWKYDRNPYLDTPFIHLALCGGRVVGMRGMYGAKWEIGWPPEAFVGPCAGDLVIAPEHRNRGLVARILEAAADDLAERGYRYAFNLSGGLATQLASLTTGWRSLGAVERATRRSGDSTARDHLRSAEHPSTAEHRPFDSLDEDSVLRRDEAGGQVSVETAPWPVRMAELVERIGGDGRLRQVRDAEYFAWRYQNPRSLYRFLFWEDSRIEGYLVLQTPAFRTGRPVTIVDWEATDARARAGLLQAAVRWGHFDHLAIWSATLSTAAKAILREAGFRLVDGPPSIGRARRERASRQTVLVAAARRDLSPSDWTVAGRQLLDPAAWDLRAIFSDNF